jgi:DNA-binding transcriptional regulator YdaS (Cro superfamily)
MGGREWLPPAAAIGGGILPCEVRPESMADCLRRGDRVSQARSV